MRVLCVGDSLTAGFYDGGAKFAPPAATLQKSLDRDAGAGKHSVEEASSCGETAVSMARRGVIDAAFEARKRLPPRVVIILGGTNDLRAWPVIEVGDVLEALAALAGAARARGAVPVVLTVPRMPAAETRSPSLTARRFELNERLKADERFICADVAAGFEEDDGAYDPDGLHLRKGGYAKLAKLAYPALRQAQRTKGAARAPKPD